MLSDLVSDLVSLELELGLLGLELDPDAALPDELGELDELEPPLAWSFFVSLDIEPEPDADPDADGEDGEVLELELDGDDGEVVEPADEEVEPDGEVVAPREAALRSPPRSHAVTSAVPRATETASASVLNLM